MFYLILLASINQKCLYTTDDNKILVELLNLAKFCKLIE